MIQLLINNFLDLVGEEFQIFLMISMQSFQFDYILYHWFVGWMTNRRLEDVVETTKCAIGTLFTFYIIGLSVEWLIDVSKM